MQRINRESLLTQLEYVQPGLSAREIIEQSSCFVFDKGFVMTYNDEIACSAACDLDLRGAVQATPLLNLLRKLDDKEIEVNVKHSDEGGASEFLVRTPKSGKKSSRNSGIRCETDVLLPIDNVERPKKWKPLAEGFTEGLRMVQQAVARDESHFSLTCVHVHTDYIEACDNYQITRADIKNDIRRPFLVKRDAIKHVSSLEMSEISESKNWVHFRNSVGLVLSCRRYIEEYPDMSQFLEVEGESIVLPKGLVSAADKAAVFSADTSDENQVRVRIKSGRLEIRGEGACGWFRERREIQYSGPAFEFLIAPDLLIEIIERHNECIISEGRLMVDGGKFKYITSLGSAEE